jgi:hypothetical protein
MASSEPIAGRCGAQVSVSERNPKGGYCELPPMKAQARCGSHGGRAPQNLAAAERRQQKAAAEAAVRTFGLRRDVSAEDALLEELQWTAGHVAWLRDRVMELQPDALVWGVSSEVDKRSSDFPGVDTTSEAVPNVWLTVYQRERQHLLAVAAAILKAGIDERRVRLAERQGALVADLIRALFADPELGLTAEQAQRAPAVAARHLRQLAGGAA